VLGALLCSLVYWFAAMLFDHRVGLVAGLLMSLDQILIAYANKVMSETFSLFFLTAALLLWVLFLVHRRWLLLCFSGIALGIATLAHGSTLYYWILLTIVFFVVSGFTPKETWLASLALVLPVFLLVGLWIGRNLAVFGVGEIVPTTNPILFTAARVLWTEHPQQGFGEHSKQLNDLVDSEFMRIHGLLALDWSDAELRHRYYRSYLDLRKEKALFILHEHATTYWKLALFSFLRMSVFPMPYAELCRFKAAQPLDDIEVDLRAALMHGFKQLLRGQVDPLAQAAKQIPACKAVGATWNILFWLLTIPAATIGLYQCIRQRLWLHVFLLVSTILYFTVGTALIQAGDGMQRYRLRILPSLYCLAAVGWCWRKVGAVPLNDRSQ
jgi:4-amino-4-deoxy-L-arabinose transferase-like glycosyltransferase